ncbi:MAG: CHAT domain-containing protein, partial [Gemmatimonadetes bacterium]|nr:CHAT domain-containing protein [Gemmatimonadota bacterium]
FVVPPTGAVRCIPLPRAGEALDRDGTSLRLTFEAAARLPASRRADFLERTQADCLESLHRLREALWEPLALEGTDVVVVPYDDLHSLPLEAAAPDLVVTRIPHPALLRPATTRRAKRALLLRGASPGTAPELAAVRRILRRHDFDVHSGRSRRVLAETADRLGVLHVAAHGTFHREGWLLSGLQLEDGWLGFEQLDRRRIEGALVHFTSCESGRTNALPGSDLEGWMTAGLAAGAREMILTLWKIDDESALEFTTEFYERWATGESAAVARAVAGRVLAAKGRHPFRWAPFLAVG